MMIYLTPDALENIEETGTLHSTDLGDLQRGDTTIETVRRLCVSGADEDRVQGWADYCDALAQAAEHGALAVAVEGGFRVFDTTSARDTWLAQV